MYLLMSVLLVTRVKTECKETVSHNEQNWTGVNFVLALDR